VAEGRRLGWWGVPGAAAGVLAGSWIAQAGHSVSPLASWAAVAAAGFAAALVALDRRAAGAREGATDFIVFAGTVMGTTAAMLVGGAAVAIALAAFALAAWLTTIGRGHPVRRFAEAALLGLPLAYGALATEHAARGLLPWALASWLVAVRGLADDVGREPGLRGAAIALALGFVLASLVLPALAGYGAPYFLVAMLAQMSVLAAATRLIVGRPERLTPLVNVAIAGELVALVVGRVA